MFERARVAVLLCSLSWLSGLSLFCVFCVFCVASPGVVRADDAADNLRQVAGILAYIGGDYRAAVSSTGEITDQGEYDEQLALAKDADALASRAGVATDAPLRAALSQLTRALVARDTPDRIAALCRDARDVIVRAHAVSLVPASVPSQAEAERLYHEHACGSCHGNDGGADTELAHTLDPPPANFLDPERVAAVSPHRAFHAISFGVSGTAMTAYPALNEAQRWSLAFYVLSLRHTGSDLAAGKLAIERARQAGSPPIPVSASALSALTEEDLLLAVATLEKPAQANALAYLRARAPFEPAQHAGSLRLAHEKLDAGVAAYREGDRDGARRLFISAYLDGFEPQEAALRAREPQLVGEIERAMLSLRASAANQAPSAVIEAQAAAVGSLLSRASRTRGNAASAFIGALTITLREGLEIVLLVSALLSLVRKRGQPTLARYVHAGWLLAIPAGILTYVVAGSLLGGLERELAEGIAAILAALMLLGVTHWLVGQLSAQRWLGFLAKQVVEATASPRARMGVLTLSFVAAYREAFEIVLFFQALALDAAHAVENVWLGAFTGLVALCAVAFVLDRAGQRLRPAPFMLASSVLLAGLSLALVGKGVRALQEAGVVTINALAAPELPWLGVHATREGLIAQGALLMLLLSSVVWPWLNARRARTSPLTPAE